MCLRVVCLSVCVPVCVCVCVCVCVWCIYLCVYVVCLSVCVCVWCVYLCVFAYGVFICVRVFVCVYVVCVYMCVCVCTRNCCSVPKLKGRVCNTLAQEGGQCCLNLINSYKQHSITKTPRVCQLVHGATEILMWIMDVDRVKAYHTTMDKCIRKLIPVTLHANGHAEPVCA